jgi:hypothetical protein
MQNPGSQSYIFTYITRRRPESLPIAPLPSIHYRSQQTNGRYADLATNDGPSQFDNIATFYFRGDLPYVQFNFTRLILQFPFAAVHIQHSAAQGDFPIDYIGNGQVRPLGPRRIV